MNSKWKWPDVPDIEKFKGTLIHTAAWPKNFDHSGKTVLVLGNGSTGVQVLPELQPAAKKLYHVVRTPMGYTSTDTRLEGNGTSNRHSQ